MINAAINGAMALLLLFLGVVALSAWMSPAWLRKYAATLMARAESVEASRTAYTDGLKHWRRVLGETPREE